MSKGRVDVFVRNCDMCGMRGVCREKHAIRYDDTMSATATADEAIPKLMLCMTCFDTPAGVKSDNEKHKRLAPEEYAAG